jgi:nucleoside transporter
MNSNVRWRLCLMMFLQYMIWGSWYPVFSNYLTTLGFSGTQTGVIYSLLSLGCMVAPFTGGQIADRYLATEKLLAIFHLIGGVALFVAARTTSFPLLVTAMAIWALVYAPTLAVTNSITFTHLPDSEKKFGLVRVWGTLGWIAVGLILSGIRMLWPHGIPTLGGADSLWVGGVVSIILGFYSFALPHTPPAKSNSNPWAFLEAAKMMRDPSFAVFVGIAFVVSTELMFYYQLTGPFLQAIGIAEANIPSVMTVAQVAEIGTMIALPFMLKRWGVRGTMAIGILSWPIRYAIFAYGQPRWLVIAALTLHGLCYVAFFVVCFIHVNNVASPDIRASAQAFITFVTIGAGMFLGSYVAGWIKDMFTTINHGVEIVNYRMVFTIPCILTVLCAVIFVLSFREKKPELAAARSPAG